MRRVMISSLYERMILTMSQAKVRDLLKYADENQFAVAAFDTYDFSSIDCVVKAAELERVPVLLMLYPSMQSFIPFSAFAAIANDAAKRASVPVGVHLDHSNTYLGALSGIPAGFQSIMFDGSVLSFEENAEISRRVVEVAHLSGVDVEAELGKVGSAANRDDFYNPDNYTRPEDAKKFVEITGVDSLAVSIGNSHGNYVCEPHLDMARLDEINRIIDTPLVLHGGSGIPVEQMVESVRHGINKVNIGTEFFAKCKECVAKEIQGDGGMWDVFPKAGEEIIEFVRGRIRRINPNGFRM